MSLAASLRSMVRLVILQLLAADLGYSQNHAVLRLALESHAAQSLTEAAVKEHLSWLEDRDLVRTEVVGPYVLATLTDLGLKVARGEDVVDGVDRPRPSDRRPGL